VGVAPGGASASAECIEKRASTPLHFYNWEEDEVFLSVGQAV